MHYTTKKLAEVRIHSVEILLFDALVLLKTQSGDVSFAKQACVLSRNEIREILMDSDSDQEKYYPSQQLEDKE